MPFCKNCGKEINENAKFCSGCGVSLTGETPSSNPQQNSTAGTPCPKCGSIIPLGNVACTNCGSLLNPDKHTTAIVLGYLCSVFLPLFGIIFGIYLLTRPNKDVHKHGIIMIILAIAMAIVWWLIFSYIAYTSSMSYYNSHYGGYHSYDYNNYYDYYDY